MDRLFQALMTLAVVVSALAAPNGPPTTLQQQPMNQQSMNGVWDRSARHHRPTSTTTHQRRVFESTTDSSQTLTTQTTAIISSPTELLKRKNEKKPDDPKCTPGDRACHSSLTEVLFCNDNQQWVQYSSCGDGEMCHRLLMVCVPEKKPEDEQPNLRIPSVEAKDQCKEGDRRCSATFNRVDRCTSGHDWVTYHDCHKSELCNGRVFDCVPLSDDESHHTAMPNGTAALST